MQLSLLLRRKKNSASQKGTGIPAVPPLLTAIGCSLHSPLTPDYAAVSHGGSKAGSFPLPETSHLPVSLWRALLELLFFFTACLTLILMKRFFFVKNDFRKYPLILLRPAPESFFRAFWPQTCFFKNATSFLLRGARHISQGACIRCRR